MTEKHEIAASRVMTGESRNEVAKDLGYASFYSLNTYMYRNNYRWDAEKKIYYKYDEKNQAPTIPEDTNFKVQRVIAKFSEGEKDPKETAAETGFKDHHEMSAFMKQHGFIWSNKLKNYEKEKPKEPEAAEPEEEENLEEYKTILKYISRNFDKLEEFLSFNSNAILPRYAVSGTNITKSVYMNNNICRLVEEYSTRKNMSQKEIFEIAVMEFMKKYGFKRELEILLNMK